MGSELLEPGDKGKREKKTLILLDSVSKGVLSILKAITSLVKALRFVEFLKSNVKT